MPARVSGVLPAGRREAIQFVIPFRAHDGARRTLVQGIAMPLMRRFLGAFLAKLPNPNGQRLTVTDGARTVLAQHWDLADRRRGHVAMIASSARVPGTPWRLTLAAPRARVFAAVDANRWLPWILLGVLGAAGLLGMALGRWLQLAADRAKRASSELAGSQEELRSLIGALDEGVAHRDASGGLHLINASARQHLGTDPRSSSRPKGRGRWSTRTASSSNPMPTRAGRPQKGTRSRA